MNTNKSFYEILGIAPGATNEDIKKAYHNQARRYHPDKNEDVNAEQIFKQVGEAYKVLSDPIKRATYDHSLRGEQASRKQRNPQDPDILIDLFVTVEEIATGCTKLCTFDRQEILSDGSLSTIKKSLHIHIRPGCPTNRKILFYREGGHAPNRIPANLVFIVRDKLHPVFTRQGANLIFEVNISLRQALCGATIQVPTLQGVPKTLCTHGSVVHPGMTLELLGLGLPYPNSDRKGSIVVSFVVQFPSTLNDEAVTALESLLSHL